jgi:ribosomal-protein-alanine N-acetyltransferase
MKTLANKLIHTNRLTLVCGDAVLLKAAIRSNEDLAAALEVEVPDNWTEFGRSPWEYALKQFTPDADGAHWWTYFPILREANTLVGSCGYKGPPDKEGRVEIGYETAAGFRNRGLATEIAIALLENAFADDRVRLVQAHTLAQVNASSQVLTKCGFHLVAVIEDPEDGKIWRWEIRREG